MVKSDVQSSYKADSQGKLMIKYPWLALDFYKNL